MIELKEVSKSFSGKTILNKISFKIEKEDRIGLVGNNGIGKSTLLKIIYGDILIDSGTIKNNDSDLIGYLPQEFSIKDNNSKVIEYIYKYVGLSDLEEKLKNLQNLLDEGKTEYVEEFCEIQEKFIQKDGYEFEYKLDLILNGLDIDLNLKNKSIGDLSGGQKNKILIAAVLLKGKELVILDEPTNNLDLNSIKWLENYLLFLNVPLIIVSHDIKFLDKVTDKTYEIDPFTRTLKTYPGNFSKYKEFKEKSYQKQLKDYEAQQKKIESLKTSINKQKNWAHSGSTQDVKDNDKFTRGYERDKSSKLASKAKKIEKQIDQLDLIERPKTKKKLRINVNSNDSKGSNTFDIINLICGYSESFYTPVLSKRLNFGDRMLLVGNNGTGKSSILKTIVEDIKPIKGSIQIGSSLNIGYIPQDTRSDTNKNIEEFLIENIGNSIDKTLLYSKMHQFGFSYDMREKKYTDLSPGERTRLYLLIFSLTNVNFLILDEPTNHLDIEAIESLEESIKTFKGSIIAVSHDREFIKKFNPNIILEIDNNSIVELDSIESLIE